MIYGSRRFKNGKDIGYLEFDTGKKVYLNVEEKKELDLKIRLWQYMAIEKEEVKNERY